MFSGRTIGDEIQVTLHNAGIAISNEELHLIFTPFHGARYTVSKDILGVGLGLSIAKKAIELNNGRLWVESEADKGTFFHFTLPRIKKNGSRG
jgi:signal transduction histidine kinase